MITLEGQDRVVQTLKKTTQVVRPCDEPYDEDERGARSEKNPREIDRGGAERGHHNRPETGQH